eukprot:jgi/Chlat1/8334/Chrsp8S08104
MVVSSFGARVEDVRQEGDHARRGTHFFERFVAGELDHRLGLDERLQLALGEGYDGGCCARFIVVLGTTLVDSEQDEAAFYAAYAKTTNMHIVSWDALALTWTPYLRAKSTSTSQSTAPSLTLPLSFFAAFAHSGASFLQWPHLRPNTSNGGLLVCLPGMHMRVLVLVQPLIDELLRRLNREIRDGFGGALAGVVGGFAVGEDFDGGETLDGVVGGEGLVGVGVQCSYCGVDAMVCGDIYEDDKSNATIQQQQQHNIPHHAHTFDLKLCGVSCTTSEAGLYRAAAPPSQLTAASSRQQTSRSCLLEDTIDSEDTAAASAHSAASCLLRQQPSTGLADYGDLLKEGGRRRRLSQARLVGYQPGLMALALVVRPTAAAAAAAGRLLLREQGSKLRVTYRHPPHHITSSPSLACKATLHTSSSSSSPSSTTSNNKASAEEETASLEGYFQRLRELSNWGLAPRRHEVEQFVVEDDVVGYLSTSFASTLTSTYPDVFTHGNPRSESTSSHKTLYLVDELNKASVSDRTREVGRVLGELGQNGAIKGWRNEARDRLFCGVVQLFPVVRDNYGDPPVLLIERAAAPYFGIKAYGVHVNAYVRLPGGDIELWVARRSATKQTWPSKLDHLANVPYEVAANAKAAGAVSYWSFLGEDGMKRDVLYVYDMEVPFDWQPSNNDGEVADFMRWPLSKVARVVRETSEYKPNCALVIIDFLIRHGFIVPDQKGYMQLLGSMRTDLDAGSTHFPA